MEGGGGQSEASGLSRGMAMAVHNKYWRLMFADSRKHSERRVSIHTRVLHTESVEHHGTATSLCTTTRRVVHAGTTADQGRGSCEEDRQRGVG